MIEPPVDWLTLGTSDPSVTALWQKLARRGGFPEPFTMDDDKQHNRWSNRRLDLLIYEDLGELSEIKSLASVEQLALLLPTRIGSPLSLNSLREELQVAHDTLRSWVENLERLYYCFRIPPFHQKLNRALKKEQKLYLWDWSQIEDPGTRFENMVASHLLKSVHAWTDLGYGSYDLHYFRDTQKREVDFVITQKRKPIVLIECKRKDSVASDSLIYLSEQLPGVPAIQIVEQTGIDWRKGQIRVVSADRFLTALV